MVKQTYATTKDTGTGVTAGGTITTTPYVFIGSAVQASAYGWGTGYFGGSIPTSVTNQLNRSYKYII